MEKEKKKMKLWKKILIVFLVLLLIFIANITRKVIILSKLDEKVTDYENNNSNIYIKTSLSFSDYESEIERFIKDDVDKMVVEKTNANGMKTKLIQITYPTERKVYTEVGDNKDLNIYKEDAPVRGSHIENSTGASYTAIRNYAYSISIQQRILDSLFTKIVTANIDGKECYKLSSLLNSNFLYSQDTTELSVFIEKDTGLPVKMIEKIDTDGNEKENVTTFEYKFNVVTDEDIKEPDETQYKIQESN